MSLASQIQYTAICDVYERIFKARGNKKIDELRSFINQWRKRGKDLKAENTDADVSLFPIMRLFLPAADRERGAHGLKEKALAALFVRVLCLGKNSPDGQKLMKYKAPDQGSSGMGDFAEKLFWVLKGRHGNITCTLTIEQINLALDNIAKQNAENQSKDSEFLRLVKQLGPSELKWFTRTILKDLKLGIGQKKLFEAYHPDADELFGDKSNLRDVCDTLLDPKFRVQKNTSNISVLSPFKPMLLERCSIEDVGKFFRDGQSYFVQTKYDGERSQIHMKDGKFKYYTRHGTDITNNNWAYGESVVSGGFLTTKISSLLNPECRSIILDGELMGWNKDRRTLGTKGMPFDVKKLTANSRHQPCFVAFDIVMYNDQLLVNVPYKDRLSFLDAAFRESEGVLLRSSITSVSTCDELLNVFNRSMDTKEEGIVLKRSDGPYKPNTREGSGCYKIKAEYSDNLIQDIDLIILGGYYGEGKHAGMFNTFLMGVLADDKDKDSKMFYSVVSVSTGLSTEKLRELEVKFKSHWLKECPKNVIGPKKNPPDAWIHPKNSLILQLRATELTRCSVHPAGYTLRFPRVVRVRDDKPWEDAWTLRELRNMVKDGGFVQKATKRHATNSDIREDSSAKVRNVRPAPMKIDVKYLGVQASGVTRVSRVLQDKEFCVINGEESLVKNDKLKKEDIECILHAHAAKVVQNPGKKTFAVIVGNPMTERVKNLANARKWDVVKLDWLQRATEQRNWKRLADWYPWEIISPTESTEKRLAERFDEFEDSYASDADEDSLKRSLSNVQTMISSQLENSQEIDEGFQELESQLFANGTSPFSLFRNIVGYFDDSVDGRTHEFSFMRGTVKDTIDATVTHVFVNGSAACLIDLYKKIDECGTAETKIVNSSWIRDCFERQELLPEDDYTIG